MPQAQFADLHQETARLEVLDLVVGARRVIVSLWNVNDKATASLMQRLYAGMLRGGKTPAAALRAAQIEMLRTRQWQSPYFWAPFVMQGEWK